MKNIARPLRGEFLTDEGIVHDPTIISLVELDKKTGVISPTGVHVLFVEGRTITLRNYDTEAVDKIILAAAKKRKRQNPIDITSQNLARVGSQAPSWS